MVPSRASACGGLYLLHLPVRCDTPNYVPALQSVLTHVHRRPRSSPRPLPVLATRKSKAHARVRRTQVADDNCSATPALSTLFSLHHHSHILYFRHQGHVARLCKCPFSFLAGCHELVFPLVLSFPARVRRIEAANFSSPPR